MLMLHRRSSLLSASEIAAMDVGALYRSIRALAGVGALGGRSMGDGCFSIFSAGIDTTAYLAFELQRRAPATEYQRRQRKAGLKLAVEAFPALVYELAAPIGG